MFVFFLSHSEASRGWLAHLLPSKKNMRHKLYQIYSAVHWNCSFLNWIWVYYLSFNLDNITGCPRKKCHWKRLIEGVKVRYPVFFKDYAPGFSHVPIKIMRLQQGCQIEYHVTICTTIFLGKYHSLARCLWQLSEYYENYWSETNMFVSNLALAWSSPELGSEETTLRITQGFQFPIK